MFWESINYEHRHRELVDVRRILISSRSNEVVVDFVVIVGIEYIGRSVNQVKAVETSDLK